MLRIFQSINRSSTATTKQFLNTLDVNYCLSRSYKYQNDIYTKKFLPLNSNSIVEQIRNEINASNKNRIEQANLYRFISAYRQYGHKISNIDPLNHFKLERNDLFELDTKYYGLTATADSNSTYATDGLLFSGSNSMSLNEIETYLKQVYSSNMTIEYDYVTSEEEKYWISKEFEQMHNIQLDANVKIEILKLLLKSQHFDNFLASKFPTFKRYSLEGGESAMSFYHSIFSNAALYNIEEIVTGIAHRGRLNLVACLLNLDPALIFTKIKGNSEFSNDAEHATGDISHHFPHSTDLTYDGKKVHVSLLQNPSHLEAVDSLVLGKARSKQMLSKDGYYADEPTASCNKVASFLIHGDAAFAGQGIVAETFQLSKLPNYAVGGTIHLIINNQLGFTAPSNLGGSGNYNSDLAKLVNCPVIHVNGDYPELAYKAGQFALKYRNTFAKDILVDLMCFRKYGHNELDDPSFTNPLMYKTINNRQSVPNIYKEKLIQKESLVNNETIEKELNNFRSYLDDSLNKVNNSTYKIESRNSYLKKNWSNMSLPSTKHISNWSTGCNVDFLRYVGVRSVAYPNDFSIHPTIERAHVKKRIERINEGVSIDWSSAEALALGSLLLQGFNVRISGQDVGRGTFSQRHAMLVDQKTNQTYIPLNNINNNQNNFLEVCNSNLSEEAVLGFDYAYSLDHPNNLVIWEAQFGDFFNGAQIIIDTYISSGESKWLFQSGLVMLLPHGFDGAGPEHSSCRIERFLQSSSSKEDAIDSDAVNYFIANPTTPANYFHLLRRQMLLPFRKPLIVASPKGLLRLPECVSSLKEMDTDTRFRPVIDDPKVKSKDSIKRILFVFGKHYYALDAEKQKRNLNDTAIVRVEELSPFPAYELRNILKEYKNVKEFVWSQEEHRNMGAWFFVAPRFEKILGLKLQYAGRDVQTCVSGTGLFHSKESKLVFDKSFGKF